MMNDNTQQNVRQMLSLKQSEEISESFRNVYSVVRRRADWLSARELTAQELAIISVIAECLEDKKSIGSVFSELTTDPLDDWKKTSRGTRVLVSVTDPEDGRKKIKEPGQFLEVADAGKLKISVDNDPGDYRFVPHKQVALAQ